MSRSATWAASAICFASRHLLARARDPVVVRPRQQLPTVVTLATRRDRRARAENAMAETVIAGSFEGGESACADGVGAAARGADNSRTAHGTLDAR